MHERNSACSESGKTTVCRIFSCQTLFEFFVRGSASDGEIVWDDHRRALSAACEWRRPAVNPRQLSLPVVIGSGSHPFPFRTRKLSLIPPMVLYGKLYGRVGRCRHYLEQPASFGSRAVVLYGCSATATCSLPGMGSISFSRSLTLAAVWESRSRL